jgi:hypothetical protein
LIHALLLVFLRAISTIRNFHENVKKKNEK